MFATGNAAADTGETPSERAPEREEKRWEGRTSRKAAFKEEVEKEPGRIREKGRRKGTFLLGAKGRGKGEHGI